VSKIYAFLSRWTKIDNAVLSPYSAAIFARMARKYAFTPRIWGVQAIAGIVIAVAMFVGACALFMVPVKQYGLDAYGIETVGTVTDVSFRHDSKTEWETVIYEFTTLQGATIKAKLDRPVQELSGLRNPFTVVYWERFPTVNSPRGVQPNGGAMFLAPFFLLFGVHFACLSRRILYWRRNAFVGFPVNSGEAGS
jgi:hypothetical protein